ncbi:MAG TPA: hypothetical protein VKM55_02735 [Candidatus Lokiarchaeia archaeon]|nr:hypothetical protein [Candidatus Lokiarchaeia archaeon]
MAFKTLAVVDYEEESFEYTTKISDDEIAFIISDQDKTIYVWTGQNASMIKKYKAGTLATKIKSSFHYYGYKTQTVKQGEETGDLQAEVDNLLQGQGTPAVVEAGLSTEASEAAGMASTGQIKADYETRIKDLEADMDKLQADNDALKASIDAVSSEFQSKIKYLDLEKEKLQGEIDAARNENAVLKESYEARLGDLRSELDRVISERDTANADMDSLRQDLEAKNKELESENDELKQSMVEKIQKIKDEAIEKIKVNFYNMKALPSAPAGSVWFESIVQVMVGDKAMLPELPKEPALPVMKAKLGEKAQVKPQKVITATEVPPEALTQEEAIEPPEETKQEDQGVIEPVRLEEKTEEMNVELDFVNLDDEKAKRKKDNELDFDLKLE